MRKVFWCWVVLVVVVVVVMVVMVLGGGFGVDQISLVCLNHRRTSKSAPEVPTGFFISHNSCIRYAGMP